MGQNRAVRVKSHYCLVEITVVLFHTLLVAQKDNYFFSEIGNIPMLVFIFSRKARVQSLQFLLISAWLCPPSFAGNRSVLILILSLLPRIFSLTNPWRISALRLFRSSFTETIAINKPRVELSFIFLFSFQRVVRAQYLTVDKLT